MKRIALIALIAFAACGGEARAADCLTLPQARAAYPGKYLVYHLDGGRRCWDAQSATRRTVRHRVSPLQTVPVSAPRPTLLWPTLASVAHYELDAAFLTAEPATAWPLLLDVDEITGGPVAECCWPALDEPPFRERWTAIPVNWLRP